MTHLGCILLPASSGWQEVSQALSYASNPGRNNKKNDGGNLGVMGKWCGRTLPSGPCRVFPLASILALAVILSGCFTVPYTVYISQEVGHCLDCNIYRALRAPSEHDQRVAPSIGHGRPYINEMEGISGRSFGHCRLSMSHPTTEQGKGRTERTGFIDSAGKNGGIIQNNEKK